MHVVVVLHLCSQLVKPGESVVEGYISNLQAILPSLTQPISSTHDTDEKHSLGSYLVVVVVAIAPPIVFTDQVFDGIV
jgi:hypothetical protein